MNAKRWTALGIAVGLFFVSILVNFATSAATGDFNKAFEDMLGATDNPFSEEVIDEGNAQKRIAVLEVEGVVTDLIHDGFDRTWTHRQWTYRLWLNHLPAVIKLNRIGPKIMLKPFSLTVHH